MKWLCVTIIVGLFFFIFPTKALAIYDPRETTNNKFGIHVIDENDFEDAAKLVNSEGGDWGYVTLVIREDERDAQRWARALEKMTDLHLIPIVRIASLQSQKGWTQGKISEIENWVNFLDTLPWSTRNRYIVIGNETNHASEWEGEISPEEYADYLQAFSEALKAASSKYFVLPAGLDASAPTASKYMDEKTYLERMVKHNPSIFHYIDGWTSHSYPNPGFSGSPEDEGRGTVRTYKWEIDLLKELGLNKELPIFITETGWINSIGEDEIGENLEKAFNEAWSDPNIIAITPFILDYPGKPFDTFSWKNKDGEYKSYFAMIQSMPKVRGEPLMETKPIFLPTIETALVYNIFHHYWTA